jgi:hypothetical protein
MPAKITPSARHHWYRQLPSPVARALGAWFDRAGTRVADGVRTHISPRRWRGSPIPPWRGSVSFLALALVLAAGARIGRAQALAHPLGHLMAMPGMGAAAAPELCRLLAADPVVVPASGDGTEDPTAAPYLQLSVDARRHELVLDVGPVDLPAHAMAEHSRELVYQLTHFPFDAWVNGFRIELVDAQGRPVPRRVLHHIDTTRPAARDLFLPVAQRFVALGAETRPVSLPGWLAGIPIHRGEPLLVSTMLHNPTATAYAGVRVRLILRYVRSHPLLEVAGFRLDVMFPTGPMEFDLPPGRTVRSWDGSPPVAARLLGITGHLHHYAEWIELKDLTTGKVIWRAVPRTNARGDVTGMPLSFLHLGLGRWLYPWHRYRITTSYWNPTGRTIPEGGMAKVAGIFTPRRGLPPIDVRDSLYQDDLRHLLGLRCGADAMMAMAGHVTHGE